MDIKPVCPNCGQWQHPTGKEDRPLDCCHECIKRGFAPVVPSRKAMIADMLAHATTRDDWGARHVKAWESDPKSRPIRLQVEALATLADTHAAIHGSDIKSDGYAGPYFEAIGEAAIKLLSMDVGGLDCGLVDGLIRRMGACEDLA